MIHMHKSIIPIWRREETELLKQEQAWIDAGGKAEHFTHLKAHKPSFMKMFECGPIGYGPLPNGCRLETEMKWLTNDALVRSHDVAVAMYRNTMLAWTADWFLRNKVKSMTVHVNRYVLHWHTEAVGNEQCHECWDLENERVDLNIIRFNEYMRYLFIKGLGFPGIPEFESVLCAIGNGFWPLGINNGHAIVMKCNSKDILPRGKRKTIRN
jgi:hypothetical protein